MTTIELPRRRARSDRLRFTVLGALQVLGCGGPSIDVGDPPTLEADYLDPDVTEMLSEMVQDVKKDPGNAEKRARLGMAYEANEIVNASRVAYEQATVLDAVEPRWWYHLARARYIEGDVLGALEDLARAIELAPTYGPAHYHRGSWLLDLGRLEEAEVAFRESTRFEHTDVAGRVGLARVFLQDQREEESVAMLEQLLTANITHPYLYYLLGTAYRQLGRIEEARQVLKGGDTSPAQYPDPWEEELDQYRVGYGADYKLAMDLRRVGRYDEAIPLMEQLRRQQPDDVTLLSNLGAAYVDVGRFDDALEALTEALEVDADHFAANLNLSTVYDMRRDYTAALEHAERAVHSNALLGRAHERRGVALAKLGRHDEALEALARSRELGANGVEGLLTSGALYADREEWDAAIHNLQAVLRIDPQSFEALAMLALARARAGDLAGARETLERLERIHPNHPAVPRVRQRVERLAGQG